MLAFIAFVFGFAVVPMAFLGWLAWLEHRMDKEEDLYQAYLECLARGKRARLEKPKA